MSPHYYFVPIPPLPWEVAHQDGLVEIVEYAVRRGEWVDAGTPVATVENGWTVMQIRATGRGVVSKTLFDRGTSVRTGDPIAIVICDGEEVPYGRPNAAPSNLRTKRSKSRERAE